MKKRITSIILIVIFVSCSAIISFTEPKYKDFVQFSKGYDYSSTDIYNISKKLVERYPDLLEIEILGETSDSNQIYVIRMTDNITKYSENDYVNKMHLLVDAGVHARETYNPFLVIKTIEDYCKDYYDNKVLNDINVKSSLKNSVIHFIPLINPDGFDLVKFGTNSINEKANKDYLINKVNGKDYSVYKSNLKGIDLNRNFEDIYYDTVKNKWISNWGKKSKDMMAYSPSGSYFSGKNASTEKETKIMQKYYLKYDFRAYLNYHSMGRIVYYSKPQLSNDFNKMAKGYASIVREVTGYGIMPEDNLKDLGYGFTSHFITQNTMKPSLTVETIGVRIYPAPASHYKTEYINKKLYKLPICFLKEANEIGYYDYKIYVDGKYVRDVMDKKYAQALAKKLGGKVKSYKGNPIYELESN